MSTATRWVSNTCTFCGVAIVAAIAIISLVVVAWVALI